MDKILIVKKAHFASLWNILLIKFELLKANFLHKKQGTICENIWKKIPLKPNTYQENVKKNKINKPLMMLFYKVICAA